jgi:hypothetical protein
VHLRIYLKTVAVLIVLCDFDTCVKSALDSGTVLGLNPAGACHV